MATGTNTARFSSSSSSNEGSNHQAGYWTSAAAVCVGVKAVDYLDAEHYWGTDINSSLLDVGYEKEILAAGLGDKLPRSHLVTTGDFDFSQLPQSFDFAFAQSVFTHLPFNHLRLCLARLAQHVEGPIAFFATIFVADVATLMTISSSSRFSLSATVSRASDTWLIPRWKWEPA